MSFKESMIEALISRGMFPNQAEKVIEKHIEENKDDTMQGRWNQDVSGYPDALQTVLWIGVKQTAYDWITVNAPEAWFRPMFQYKDAELTQMANLKS